MEGMSRNLEFSTAFGSARLTPSGYLHNVQVSVDHRGQGHGHALLRMVTADADRRGISLTTQARPELHGFYAQHGFAPTDTAGPLDEPTLRREAAK